MKIGILKIIAIVLCFSTVFTFVGCQQKVVEVSTVSTTSAPSSEAPSSEPEPAPEPEPEPEPVYALNPLTGLNNLNPNAVNNRPVAVMV